MQEALLSAKECAAKFLFKLKIASRAPLLFCAFSVHFRLRSENKPLLICKIYDHAVYLTKLFCSLHDGCMKISSTPIKVAGPFTVKSENLRGVSII